MFVNSEVSNYWRHDEYSSIVELLINSSKSIILTSLAFEEMETVPIELVLLVIFLFFLLMGICTTSPSYYRTSKTLKAYTIHLNTNCLMPSIEKLFSNALNRYSLSIKTREKCKLPCFFDC